MKGNPSSFEVLWQGHPLALVLPLPPPHSSRPLPPLVLSQMMLRTTVSNWPTVMSSQMGASFLNLLSAQQAY